MADLTKEDKEEIEEIVEEQEDPDPEWIRKGDPPKAQEPDYEFELFLSTDGKHTVHVKANRKNENKALIVATETYDYIKTRYGTKQAQAVKEYGNGKGKPVVQETCKHTNVAFKESKTEANPGRWFKTCKDCGAFLGWKS